MCETLFITGTDTGVGKTVLAALLTRFLHVRKANVAALKPVCSGGRGDARVLRAASNGALSLDEINPWHFHAPVAPLLAARRERRRVLLADVVAHVRAMQKRFDWLLVEGAGGLLSPLGLYDDRHRRPSQHWTGLRNKSFDSRDLIVALGATAIIVCPNRLGAVNQALVTLEALPRRVRSRARVVLVSPGRPDFSGTANAKLLGEFFDARRVLVLPWLGKKCFAPDGAARKVLRALTRI